MIYWRYGKHWALFLLHSREVITPSASGERSDAAYLGKEEEEEGERCELSQNQFVTRL